MQFKGVNNQEHLKCLRSAIFVVCMPSSWLHLWYDSLAHSVFLCDGFCQLFPPPLSSPYALLFFLHWCFFQCDGCLFLSFLYLPTFSEMLAWDFYPGSAGIFENDTIISEEVRSLPKTSEVCRRRSYRENAYPQNQRTRGRYCHLFILHIVFVPYMGLR